MMRMKILPKDELARVTLYADEFSNIPTQTKSSTITVELFV